MTPQKGNIRSLWSAYAVNKQRSLLRLGAMYMFASCVLTTLF